MKRKSVRWRRRAVGDDGDHTYGGFCRRASWNVVKCRGMSFDGFLYIVLYCDSKRLREVAERGDVGGGDELLRRALVAVSTDDAQVFRYGLRERPGTALATGDRGG